jgi:hypothetical protein
VDAPGRSSGLTDALADASTLAGGVLLGRAIDDKALSDEILRNVRAAIPSPHDD